MAAGYEQVTTCRNRVGRSLYPARRRARRPPTAPPVVDLIVLLDLVMPEIDGIEACARIRGDNRYVDVPVIMVTAANDMDSLSSAFIAGATDYITKPFNRIGRLLAGASARRSRSRPSSTAARRAKAS